MHRRRPQLKNGVDLQLQTAFFDGNWPTAIRLADKRSKALKDQYYEVVKVVCEGQLDDPVTKLATVNAVKQYLKDGTVVKDADGLDLLEWATQAFFTDDDYLETLGPLRVRAVKAFPKDKISGAKNLESCLMHWDLTSAQQIAAIMDKSFPNEKKFLFWNIAITHMLSGSSQSPADKKKLYGMLAQKQIERAAQAAEQAVSGNTKPPARSVQSEEEILLLYAIVEKHGSPADYDKLVNSPLFNPNEQFRKGRKELFLRVIAKYSKESRWSEVYDICKKSLSETDSDGKLSLLASDWMVWQHFIKAAGHLQTTDDSAAKSLQELLLKLIKSPGLRPIYRKNLLLARVAAVFELSLADGADRSEGGDSSTRLQELTQYIKDQKGSPTCFEDVKSFVERLDRSGMNYLAYELLPHLHEGVEVLQDADYTRVAALKMQYFILSCPLMYDTVAGEKPRYKCQACSQECDFEACEPCIADISRRALAFHSETLGRNPDKSFNARTNDSSRFEGDAPSQLLILAALCSIKLANPDKHGSCVGLPADSIRHLVHAVSLLEYGRLALPKYSDYLLLLFQLHLVLGTGPNAADHWDNLAVKRTIVDSLGPLFYDRLSAVSPGMCSIDDDGNEPLDVLNSHYIPSLQLRMPRKLIDAFQNDSYGSVIGIPEYMEKLRYSCTRAMGFVEEAKVERTTGYSLDDFMIDSRFAELTSPTKLNEVVDYGSFPSLECSTNPPVWARLRLGPPPTDTRCRLAIYAEAFYNVLMYKPPSTYKVAPGKADHAFVVEKLCQISSQMGCIKRGPGDGSTAEERIHFEVITILSTLIPLCVDSGREPEAVEAAGPMCEAVKSALDALEGRIPALGGMDVPEVVRFCGSMQPVAALRDVASAARISADWILHFAEKEKERDRSGQSNLPKELVAHVKDLQAAAAAALKRGREMVDAAAAKAKSGPFMVKVGAEWAFAGAGCGHIRETTEEYSGAASLAVGWAKNLQGWQEVTWE